MNPYEVLGLSENATADEIKSAYRKLAREYHPDVNKSPDAEDKFKQLGEAYSILTDPQKKARYEADLNGNPFGSGMPFGFDFDFNPFGHQRQSRMENSPVSVRINISLAESFKNFKKNITFSKNVFCAKCNGNGGLGEKATCRECNGAGNVVKQIRQGMFTQQFVTPCGSCQGRGSKFTSNCSDCNSSGLKSVVETVEVDVKKGSIFNSQFIKAKGNQENKSIDPGPVIIEFELSDVGSFEFDRNGNVKLDFEVDPIVAILGKDVEVDLPEGGKTTIKMKEYTTNGQKFNLPKKGLFKDENARTDFVINVVYKTPKNLSQEQKDILQNYVSTLK
jgi:molecular chaperone DnaJ